MTSGFKDNRATENGLFKLNVSKTQNDISYSRSNKSPFEINWPLISPMANIIFGISSGYALEIIQFTSHATTSTSFNAKKP